MLVQKEDVAVLTHPLFRIRVVLMYNELLVQKYTIKERARILMPIGEGGMLFGIHQLSFTTPFNDGESLPLYFFQRLFDVGQDVFHIFDAHRKADEIGCDASLAKLLIRQLSVRMAGRMQHAGACISHMRNDGNHL